MAYTSEIEKLEARYRENPKGRNFAPLADAYRKAGLVDNAIDLCQAGLQLHPDYVSGHIVHGRCLIDKKDDTGADAVFRRVLELDPENILALKVLADIAERNERFDGAAEWLDRLLLADPMNGEAAEGLSRVRGKAAARAAAAPPPSVSPVAETPEHAETPAPTPPGEPPGATVPMEAAELSLDLVQEDAAAAPAAPSSSASSEDLGLERLEGPFDAALADAATAAMNSPDFELERASEPARPTTASGGGEIEVFDGTIDFDSVAQEAAPPEGIQLEEPPAAEPEPGEVQGLARTQYEGSGLFRVEEDRAAPEARAGADRPTSPMTDLPLIMPEDVGAGPELEPEPAPEPATAAAVPGPEPAAPTIPRLPDDDGAADTETLSRAEPVVTETMAELYLRQGHRQDARRVYEALSAQRPHDERLQQKLAELSAELPVRRRSGQTAGAFLKRILQARPGTPATSYQPPAPQATPVEAPAAAEAPPSASAPAPGSPTRPAGDAFSLDAVFGEEGARSPMPAERDAAPEKPAKLPEASGGFSFDDFFGTAGGSGPAGSDSAAARTPRPSGRGRGGEQEEDLDQFQAWLKSLKA